MAATDPSATTERTAVDGLRALFAPRAVAVIGVSRDKAGFGRRVFDNLLAGGFRGPVYAVNPNAPEIAGIAGHRAYRSIKDLPAGVECAIVAVPADAVPGVLAESAAAGIKALVVISAGFAEAGATGRQQQDGRARGGTRPRRPPGGPQLHGRAEHPPFGPPQRHVRRAPPATRAHRRRVSERRARASRCSKSPTSGRSGSPRS